MTRPLNKLLNRLGLHVIKNEDPGKIPWVLKNLDTSPSAFRWIAPELIRRHNLKTFFQVGANDGQCGDPIEGCIEAFGLQGVMVEPQPKPCALLKEKYAGNDRVAIDQVAVSEKEGFITLYHFAPEHIATRSAVQVKADLLASTDRGHLEKMRQVMEGTGEIQEMKVPALTWKSLIHKHSLPAPDMVIVDTEGMDDTIVNQVGLGDNAPALIQFEHLHIGAERLEACTGRLRKAGYRFIMSEYDILCLHKKVIA